MKYKSLFVILILNFLNLFFAEFLCHVYHKHDGLVGVVIADQEYPKRAAHCLIARILEEFSSTVQPARWQNADEKYVLII